MHLHHHPVVASDTAARRRHRRLQGEWRAGELGLPAGPGAGSGGPVDSMLPLEQDGASAESHGWNLMSPAAVGYARSRIPEVRALHGVVEPGRLWRNMLSSQPMAFSIAGELRAHPGGAVGVLAALSGVDLAGFTTIGDPDDPYRLDGLQAEWAPRPAEALGDRTAADLAAGLLTRTGRRLLLTIEVKYTEPFSPAPLDPRRPRYAAALDAVGLSAPDAATLRRNGGTQFLRSVLLTDSVRRAGRCDDVLAVVLGRGDDRTARGVVTRVGAAVPVVEVQYWSHEALFGACAAHPALRAWAARMTRRYVPGS